MDVRAVDFAPEQMEMTVEHDAPDFVKDGGACRRRERRHDRCAERTDDAGKRQVRRTERRSPLKDAVRLVDGNVRNGVRGNARDEPLVLEDFRVCEDDFCAMRHTRKDALPLFGCLPAVQDSALDSRLLHAPPLVFHERTERIQDERRPVKKQRGNKKTQRLSASCGEDDNLPSPAVRLVVASFRKSGPRRREPRGVENVRNHEPLPRGQELNAERLPGDCGRLVNVKADVVVRRKNS